MGETWEEEGEQIETDDLFKRRERYNCEVPEEVLVLTAGVDVQDDRFEVEVVGWGVDKESWGIKYQVIYGDLKLKPCMGRTGPLSFTDVHHRRRAAAENYLRLRGFRRTLHDAGLPLLQGADSPACVRNQGKRRRGSAVLQQAVNSKQYQGPSFHCRS